MKIFCGLSIALALVSLSTAWAQDTMAIAEKCAREAGKTARSVAVKCETEEGVGHMCTLRASPKTGADTLGQVKTAVVSCMTKAGGTLEPPSKLRKTAAEFYRFGGQSISLNGWELNAGTGKLELTLVD